MKPINQMNKYELQDVEREIEQRKMDLIASKLGKMGLPAMTNRNGDYFEYVLVFAQDDGLNVWATVEECERLASAQVNLKDPREAFRRFREYVTEKYAPRKYTKAEAIRDTQDARSLLLEKLESGKIDSSTYGDLYKSTSFMDLAE